MRPAYMTKALSQNSATTLRLCVISMTAVPRSVTRRSSTSSTWACVVTSRAVVGSSAITRSGWFASAIAISTRCRMPPEYWWG